MFIVKIFISVHNNENTDYIVVMEQIRNQSIKAQITIKNEFLHQNRR